MTFGSNDLRFNALAARFKSPTGCSKVQVAFGSMRLRRGSNVFNRQ
jgi:hypothetical protein